MSGAAGSSRSKAATAPGKSLQAAGLADRLERLGLKVVRTREPGGSPRAEALREILLSGGAAQFGPTGEALLFGAARIDHIDQTIRPALESGAWVVCDRFADSTRAYQGAAGKVEPQFIASLERVVVGDCQSEPDAHSRPSHRAGPRAHPRAARRRGRRPL